MGETRQGLGGERQGKGREMRGGWWGDMHGSNRFQQLVFPFRDRDKSLAPSPSRSCGFFFLRTSMTLRRAELAASTATT